MQYFFNTGLLYPLMAVALLMVVTGSYLLHIWLLKERLELLKMRLRLLERANQELQDLSCLDGLTGIANRRHFEKTLDLEWRRACRAGTALSMIMIDVDFFKDFNDVHGHQRGDDCLTRLAGTLRDALHRPGDLAARYGGDEFAIVLPGTNAQGASDLAEAIRARVELMGVTQAGPIADEVVTVSQGVVTCYPYRGLSAAALIAAADEALHQAKGGGRNQVAISGEVVVRY